MMDEPLTQDTLVDLLHYDEEAGEFFWRKDGARGARGHVKAGKRAGSLHRSSGYRMLKINGRRYSEHRLAWFYVHGQWPAGDLDHVDGARANNRIVNLREASRSQNIFNSKLVRSSSGVRGVTWNKRERRWKANLKKDQQVIHLGTFETLPDAIAARAEAAKRHFGDFAP